MCCLCQPELGDDEYKLFRNDAHLRRGLTNTRITGERRRRADAIRLQGGCGACYFLKQRRCTIYDIRPAFCVHFPVHFHSLSRIQIVANLSCRGIAINNRNDTSSPGTPLECYGRQFLTDDFLKLAIGELKRSRSTLCKFSETCREAHVFQEEGRLREMGVLLSETLIPNDAIGKALSYAGRKPDIGNASLKSVVKEILETHTPDDICEVASEGNYCDLNLHDISWLPVYTDEDLTWNVFQSHDGRIKHMRLHENGRYDIINEYEYEDIRLLPLGRDAADVFSIYARTMAGRDCLIGHAYHVCAEEGYKTDLLTVYIGVTATAMLDMWWRASLICRIKKRSRIDSDMAVEGIRGYDMDFLDKPSLGTFF